MYPKKFITKLVMLGFIIFLLNYLAVQFYWYTSIWYFDIIMHFLGGIWVGFMIIWFLKIKLISSKTILQIILGVFLIGVLWEFFEIILNDYTTQNPFNILDTVSDIFCDLAGGTFATLYFLKKIMSIKENIVQ